MRLTRKTPRQKKYRFIEMEEAQNIVAHYKRGFSLRDCACLFDRSVEGIRQTLIARKVKLRARYYTKGKAA